MGFSGSEFRLLNIQLLLFSLKFRHHIVLFCFAFVNFFSYCKVMCFLDVFLSSLPKELFQAAENVSSTVVQSNTSIICSCVCLFFASKRKTRQNTDMTEYRHIHML